MSDSQQVASYAVRNRTQVEASKKVGHVDEFSVANMHQHWTVAVCSPGSVIYIGQPLNIYELGSKELVWESTGNRILNQTSNP